jgi:DNA (cytosine-5)-methyltransferase 1
MTEHLEKIPVIDLFAGPGGLAEGFSAFRSAGGNRFRVCLSIEKDPYAHSTLELRSFFRQFPKGQVPEEYYAYLRKEISRDQLFASHKKQADAAKKEAWQAELGSPDFPVEEVDKRIEKAIGGSENWPNGKNGDFCPTRTEKNLRPA